MTITLKKAKKKEERRKRIQKDDENELEEDRKKKAEDADEDKDKEKDEFESEEEERRRDDVEIQWQSLKLILHVIMFMHKWSKVWSRSSFNYAHGRTSKILETQRIFDIANCYCLSENSKGYLFRSTIPGADE